MDIELLNYNKVLLYAEQDVRVSNITINESTEYLRHMTVIIGDSLSKGDDGQPYKGLANIGDWLKYYTKQPIQNNGIWGNTLDEVIDRLQRDVVDLKPIRTIILAGTNDINKGETTNDMIVKAMKIGTDLFKNNIKPIFISIPPRNDKPELNKVIREYNNKLEYWCMLRNFEFIDIYSTLANPDGTAKESILSPHDDLHWTSQGAYHVAKKISESIPKLSNFEDKLYSRFYEGGTMYDNFEFATYLTFNDVGEVADSWTPIGIGDAKFSIETNPHQVLGAVSNYQVIDKTTNSISAAGISQKVYGYVAGDTYRTELDVDWRMTGNIDGDTTLRCVLAMETSTGIIYETFVDSYNLRDAYFRPFVDIKIPEDTKSVTLEVYGYGAANFELKVGRVVAYNISITP